MGKNTSTQHARALKRAQQLHAAGDQRWMEVVAELAASKGYKELGYPTLTALTADKFGIADKQVAYKVVRAGTARAILRNAGIAVPNTGVSINGLRRVTSEHIPLIAESVANGHDLNAAMRSAYKGDALSPLFTPPSEPPDRDGDIHPNAVMLAQAVEALGFHTPVPALLDAEAVLVACAAGLAAILTRLQQVEEPTPTINQNRSS